MRSGRYESGDERLHGPETNAVLKLSKQVHLIHRHCEPELQVAAQLHDGDDDTECCFATTCTFILLLYRLSKTNVFLDNSFIFLSAFQLYCWHFFFANIFGID